MTDTPELIARPQTPTFAEFVIAFMGQAAEIERLQAQLAEMTRRRDEWQKKADGFDEIRLALREKVGRPWPPSLSRALWAGIAADEKKRADDAGVRVAELEHDIHEASDPDFLFGAMDNVADMDVTLTDYAAAASRAIRAALIVKTSDKV